VLNHLKVTIMAILKRINARHFTIFLVVFFISCNDSNVSDFAFEDIIIKNDVPDVLVAKAEMVKYKQGSGFTASESDKLKFTIIKDTINNETYLTPKFDNKGILTSDIVILINDSLQFKITDIITVKDTTTKAFSGRKTQDIANKIKSFKSNSIQVENNGASFKLKLSDAKNINKK